MSTQDFLVEIGTEEMPPRALPNLSAALQSNMEAALKEAGLAWKSITPYATPRRLALLVTALQDKQATRRRERLGPALDAAFDDSGAPTKAALGFARSCGVDVAPNAATDASALDSLDRVEKDGVTRLAFISEEPGKSTASLLPEMVHKSLAALPIPRPMRWGASSEEFIRPVHWLLMLFGGKVVPATILGADSGDVTYGHRLHYNKPIKIKAAASYAKQLESTGKVMACFESRRARIHELVEKQARRLKAQVDIDADLLDEATALVEWPVALSGSFDEDFLQLPPEVLVLTMKTHQKCFCLRDKRGKLLPAFITVSNIESSDPKQVVAGNERVIRPRLADARFFYDSDSKQPLASRREQLKDIVFQEKLGSVYDKSQRVEQLAAHIAKGLGVDETPCREAARLAKCDLLTSMVGEFPELQGIMGQHYLLQGASDKAPAAVNKKQAEVAAAIAEQYQPRFAGDALPATKTGAVLALAEKLDTIVGLFAIAQPPTGSKDPFALRRAAIGVLRILVEKEYDLDVYEAIGKTAAAYKKVTDDTAAIAEQVFAFLLERFRAWYQDEGVVAEIFLAVQAVMPRRPLDFHQRLQAVQAFAARPEAASLAAANKRVANILAKEDAKAGTKGAKPGEKLPDKVDESLLADKAEVALFKKVQSIKPGQAYSDALTELAGLRDSVDKFFDDVLVMHEDDALRRNRLALLRDLRGLFLQVADISYLHQA